MKNSLKQISKNTKGITLMALVITIVLLLILASISVYSGVNVVKSSRFTSFTAELKIMQTQINEMYQKYTDGGSIDVGGNTYTGEEILNIGKDITSSQDVTDQANFVFTSAESGITDKTGYKYFDLQTIKDLNIEGVEGEFFINIQKRSIVSYDGFNYENEMYYTLDQIPNGFYNVEYEENINKPTFDLAVETIEDGKWRITISNIEYNGYIDKWEVKYQIDGQEHWNTSEDYTFFITEAGNYSFKIENGDVSSDIVKENVKIPDTKPFLPDGAEVTNNDLDTGFTIKDKNGNEWVWIEVPKSIYTNTEYNGGTAPTNSEDYEKIESVMKEYAKDYRSASYKDTWYSEAQHGFASADDYNDHKNKMLKSVYENGGFYIGKYEVGTETLRNTEEAELTIPVIKEGAYPYNYVTCKQAQELSNSLATGGRTSSLMFGIQWDLILKDLQTKGKRVYAELNIDSRSWGNYKSSFFEVMGGKYSENDGKDFNDITNTYEKQNGKAVLFTTGVIKQNEILNINDLAGNVGEWTLEYSSDILNPCCIRGGIYTYNIDKSIVSNRASIRATDKYSYSGFRTALW